MRTKITFVLAIGLAIAADDPPKKEADLVRERLQGVWVRQSAERDGKAVEVQGNQRTTLTFKDDTMTWMDEKIMGNMGMATVSRWTFRVDPSKKPAHLDLTAAEFAHKGKLAPSIYSLDGDTLTICMGQTGEKKRPEQFVTKPGDTFYLIVLKRQK